MYQYNVYYFLVSKHYLICYFLVCVKLLVRVW